MKNILISSTYFKVNSKLAKVLGIRESIFLISLYDSLQSARKFEKVFYIDDEEYFTVSRTDIALKTTISTTSQRRIEKKLEESKVLKCAVSCTKNQVLFHINEEELEMLLIQKEE